MRLHVDGDWQTFIPLQTYRIQHHLSSDFSVARFEPKTWEGLGNLDGAGVALQTLTDHVLQRIPTQIDPAQTGFQLADVFRHALESINDEVGLRDSEVDFAVAGFQNVVDDFLFASMRSKLLHEPMPNFEQVYHAWLMQTIRVSSVRHEYTPPQGAVWHVQVIHHAYGRVGLRVEHAEHVDYIADHALACPAENFMMRLLKDVCSHLAQRL